MIPSRFILAFSLLLAVAMPAQAQTVTITSPNTVNPSGQPTTVNKTFLYNPDGSIVTPSAVNVDNVLDGVVRSDVVSSATSSPNISTVGYGGIVFQGIANASANTIVVEGSNDLGVTWSIIAIRSVTAATGISITSIPIAAGGAYVPITVMPLMRWRVFTYVSGSTTVAIGLKRQLPTVGIDASISSMPALPAGGNNVGAFYPQLAGTSGAGTPLYFSYVLSSAATTNSNLILTGPRRLVSGQICNINATIKQYVKFYNKATAPTVGTDTPLDIFTLQPSTCLSLEPMIGNFGQHFSLGLGIGITGGFPVADTTAVAAGDVTINALYL